MERRTENKVYWSNSNLGIKDTACPKECHFYDDGKERQALLVTKPMWEEGHVVGTIELDEDVVIFLRKRDKKLSYVHKDAVFYEE